MLEPLWRRVKNRCGVSGGSVDLYVHRSRGLNAYAVGSRSVAVTSGILSSYRAGRIDARAVEAVLAHELGHSSTNGSRFMPVTLWLAMRLFSRTVLRVSMRFTEQQPRALLAMVILTGFGVAIVQTGQHDAWDAVVVLGALCLFGIWCTGG